MEQLLIEKHNRVCWLTLNRPKVRNAVDSATMLALREAILAADDGETRLIVIRGAGGHFCAGADIQQGMAAAQAGESPQMVVYTALTEAYHPALLAIRDTPLPVIAAVEGYAAGLGCDLALRCDLRLASSTAIFAELFVRVGLIPDGGGTYLLPRLAGLGRAMEMMLLGEDIDAETALSWGLVNRVFPAESFAESVQVFAEKLAHQAPLALRHGKQAMLAALENTTYAQALQREAATQRDIFGTQDGLEGFRAFLEKRPPQWKGQ